MGKYDSFRVYLIRAGNAPVEMTFAEIADIVGGLPASAYDHRAWWANENAVGRHVQANAWLGAGRSVTEVNMLGKQVRFSERFR